MKKYHFNGGATRSFFSRSMRWAAYAAIIASAYLTVPKILQEYTSKKKIESIQEDISNGENIDKAYATLQEILYTHKQRKQSDDQKEEPASRIEELSWKAKEKFDEFSSKNMLWTNTDSIETAIIKEIHKRYETQIGNTCSQGEWNEAKRDLAELKSKPYYDESFLELNLDAMINSISPSVLMRRASNEKNRKVKRQTITIARREALQAHLPDTGYVEALFDLHYSTMVEELRKRNLSTFNNTKYLSQFKEFEYDNKSMKREFIKSAKQYISSDSTGIIKEPAQFVDQVHFYLQKEDLRTSKEISSLIIEKFLKKNSEKPEGAWGSFGKMYSFAKDQSLENYLGPLIKLTVESASREKDRNERERKIEATLYQFYRLNDSFSPAQRKEIQETIAQTYLQLIDSTKHSQSANIYTLIQGLHPSKKVLQKADSLVLFK